MTTYKPTLPHLVTPDPGTVHVVIAYKNFAASKGISHIGLGVTAMTNAKILNAAGFWTEVWPIVSIDELRSKIAAAQRSTPGTPVTHVVISAPWLATADLAALATLFHQVDFSVVSHSNVGFLQADPNGITLLRQAGDLQTGSLNFHIGANSQKFIDWWQEVYHQPMRWLPNMYAVTTDEHVHQHWTPGATFRIGSFGALRPLKNLLTAGAAALEVAQRLQTRLEFNISAGRAEGGGDTVLRGLLAMYADLPDATVVQNGWQSWPVFLRLVRSMDLLLQPSYTESFSMVTADAIGQGVPVVGSDAIDWLPRRWIASNDDASSIADVAAELLLSPHAAKEGLPALKYHNATGLRSWSAILTGHA
jgi:glycosyltransferase involved in cell wall biosynthesis